MHRFIGLYADEQDLYDYMWMHRFIGLYADAQVLQDYMRMHRFYRITVYADAQVLKDYSICGCIGFKGLYADAQVLQDYMRMHRIYKDYMRIHGIYRIICGCIGFIRIICGCIGFTGLYADAQVYRISVHLLCCATALSISSYSISDYNTQSAIVFTISCQLISSSLYNTSKASHQLLGLDYSQTSCRSALLWHSACMA